MSIGHCVSDWHAAARYWAGAVTTSRPSQKNIEAQPGLQQYRAATARGLTSVADMHAPHLRPWHDLCSGCSKRYSLSTAVHWNPWSAATSSADCATGTTGLAAGATMAALASPFGRVTLAWLKKKTGVQLDSRRYIYMYIYVYIYVSIICLCPYRYTATQMP